MPSFKNEFESDDEEDVESIVSSDEEELDDDVGEEKEEELEDQDEVEEEKEKELEEEEEQDDVEEKEEEKEEDEQNDDDDEDTEGGENIIIGGKIPSFEQHGGASDDDDEDDEENNEGYLQKFNADINKQYLLDFHPEAMIHNYQEISALTTVIRDANNNIIDKLHRTLPYLTKYERARVLGQRAKQINSGAKAFVKVPENIIDGYLVAELELAQARIPFIIRRPIPGGACEYWKLKDLEIIGF
uniref:DNA-directed RNA polymerase n=1 Tax=viral metagenome TaxID=1070528 RepID=A0A6C0B9V4_9ZZZZ